MASAYLTTGNLTTGGNQKKWTFSAWIKKATTGTSNGFMSYWSTSANYFTAKFTSADQLQFGNVDSGAWTTELVTNAVYKDTSAYYHIVYHYNSAEATSSDRAKMWVNGEQITSFTTEQYPSQNANTKLPNNGYPLLIGVAREGTNYRYLDGIMTHVHFCDGYAYEASDFGETDSTTGIWKPKTTPSVSYGTNGFFLDFADSSNFGNDISGQNNDLSVGGGTITQTIDTPSNVFATLNPLSTSPITGTGGYFSNGNTVYDAPESSPYDIATGSTLGVSKGKWYWEVKWVIDGGGSTQAAGLGIYESDQPIDLFGNMRGASGYKNVIWDTRHDLYVNGSDTGDNYTAASGDILGLALDLDNGTLKIHKNGTYFNSGNAVTTAIDTSKTYLILASPNGGSGNHSTLSFNFGNGYFGTTAVASAGTNAGIGTFEYDVPSGYKAICTKNINAQEYS